MVELSSRLALFVGAFGGGGVERVTAALAHNFVRLGIQIDLVLDKGGSPHLWRMPSETRIIDLQSSRFSRCLPGLVGYLRQEKPFALLAADHYMNEFALLARRIADAPTRVIISEHNHLSSTTLQAKSLKARLKPTLTRFLYPWADGIVAVSQGVADDLARTAKLPLENIKTIYNPVIHPEMLAKAKESVDHPWFKSKDVPVLLGVGKLEAQKDFPTLLHAFAKVRQVRQARLVILGWGPDRPELEALVRQLGIEEDVDLPGYVQNPYAYMARSDAFVLSSAWEGLPTVLIEAMAVGTPVISTNCESGPSEILADGKYGYLTPVGNPQALAEAILQVLEGDSKPIDPAWLEQFGLEAATRKYLDILGIESPSITADIQWE